MTAPAAAPVTVVVLTFNEERNLERCLASACGWAAQVFVVDSGSTDQTIDIARRLGAEVVSHPFETHATQWRWALTELPIRTAWVLGLDADQEVTPALRDSIVSLANDPAAPAVGAYVTRKQIFRGRWIRFGGYYPKHLLKMFRRHRVMLDAADLVDHHFIIDGPTTILRGDLIEDNRNEAEISVWTAKHNRYAVLQARQELAAADRLVGVGALFGTPDQRVQWLKQIWALMPLYIRPCLYVLYRYVLRLGFLDGKQGFVFHVLQGFWYRLLVDINIDELRAARRAVGETPPRAAAPLAKGDEPFRSTHIS